MLEKIVVSQVSGFTTTVLEAAVALGLATGGWCPHGHARIAEYGVEPIGEKGALPALERSVAESHGTLCFFAAAAHGDDLVGEAIKQSALRLNRPYLAVRLGRESAFAAAQRIAGWIDENDIAVLHVGGAVDNPEDRSAGTACADILEATVYLSMMGSQPLPPPQTTIGPETVAAALAHLDRALPLKDRTTIANLSAHEVTSLRESVGGYIHRHFGLFDADSDLLADCRRHSGQEAITPDDAVDWLIRELWERLRATCRIRIVK